MAFPPSFIDELVARNPIEDVVGQHVNLKRSGAKLFGLCPFHGEKTASFSVAPDKGMYYCFGCGVGGNRHHGIPVAGNLGDVLQIGTVLALHIAASGQKVRRGNQLLNRLIQRLSDPHIPLQMFNMMLT